jgi:hypothetical protein
METQRAVAIINRLISDDKAHVAVVSSRISDIPKTAKMRIDPRPRKNLKLKKKFNTYKYAFKNINNTP